MRIVSLVFLAIFLIYHVECWESYEMDLFDLVEEVGENFYQYFGVERNCDSSEIKKAYRKLSLQWHPDKNPDPQAEVKFREIVGIYEVLKDDVKRARYNEILENGLPDWKQPIYYFRRVRKLSLYELTIAISIIISIGHYFVLWAQYFEKKLTIEDRMDDVKKMLEKKQKKKKTSEKLDKIDATLQEFYANLPSPKLQDTLPYRFSIWFFYALIGAPGLIKAWLKPAVVEQEEEEEEAVVDDVYQKKKAQASRLHKELEPTKIEKSDIAAPVLTYNLGAKAAATQEPVKTDMATSKEWTDKQKNDLIKAIVRFPAGSSNRWINIAEFVGRHANDCIQMEKQMKQSITSTNHSSLNSSTWSGGVQKRTVNITEEPTTRFPEEQQEDVWSQEQQKCLEKALKEITKDVSNRWDRIAEQVPNKTKDECIARYKQLCTSLKKSS